MAGSEADPEGVILLHKEVPGFFEESCGMAGLSVSSPNMNEGSRLSCTLVVLRYSSSTFVVNQALSTVQVCLIPHQGVSFTQGETEVE